MIEVHLKLFQKLMVLVLKRLKTLPALDGKYNLNVYLRIGISHIFCLSVRSSGACNSC